MLSARYYLGYLIRTSEKTILLHALEKTEIQAIQSKLIFLTEDRVKKHFDLRLPKFSATQLCWHENMNLTSL